jgi:membrane-bound lytic murein transglycosylase B
MRFPRTDNADARSFLEPLLETGFEVGGGTSGEAGLAECESRTTLHSPSGIDFRGILGRTGFSRGAMLRRKARGQTATRRFTGRLLGLVFCIALVHTQRLHAANSPDKLTTLEAQRLSSLRKRLCSSKQLSCDYVDSIFDDPRLTIYEPPPPSVSQGPSGPPARLHERNPYLTERFGLLTPESLERCRLFIQAHTLSFDAAEHIYGVPREVICGHLRIETDFGIVTALTPYPLGRLPAVDRLVSLYVRRPATVRSSYRFVSRQRFAETELTDLLAAAKKNDWDVFKIPGSSTGAIGLVQFEPSVFDVAVDADGDGKIDLFNPDDAILSVAHYLVTRGWDDKPEHQKRAVYAYYGGHYNTDRYKFYMKAVLAYADAARSYLKDHPCETEISLPEAQDLQGANPDQSASTNQEPTAN